MEIIFGLLIAVGYFLTPIALIWGWIRWGRYLQRGGPIRNVVTRLRTKSGEIKLTAYLADRIQFDGQSCILAVSEDLPDYDRQKVN